MYVTSPLKMDNSLGKKESGIIILRSLGKLCLYSKREVRSASRDGKRSPGH